MSKINEADITTRMDPNAKAETPHAQSASVYKIADLINAVNPADTEILKYLPSAFLDAEQEKGKQQGIKETEEYVTNKEKARAAKADKSKRSSNRGRTDTESTTLEDLPEDTQEYLREQVDDAEVIGLS